MKSEPLHFWRNMTVDNFVRPKIVPSVKKLLTAIKYKWQKNSFIRHGLHLFLVLNYNVRKLISQFNVLTVIPLVEYVKSCQWPLSKAMPQLQVFTTTFSTNNEQKTWTHVFKWTVKIMLPALWQEYWCDPGCDMAIPAVETSNWVVGHKWTRYK